MIGKNIEFFSQKTLKDYYFKVLSVEKSLQRQGVRGSLNTSRRNDTKSKPNDGVIDFADL